MNEPADLNLFGGAMRFNTNGGTFRSDKGLLQYSVLNGVATVNFNGDIASQSIPAFKRDTSSVERSAELALNFATGQWLGLIATAGAVVGIVATGPWGLAAVVVGTAAGTLALFN